jgi:hypothetical protein
VIAPTIATVAIAIATQNVYVGLPPDRARHDIRQATAQSSIVLTQEMGSRHAREFAPRGWAVAHRLGPWVGDCATFYDTSVWRRRDWWTFPITKSDAFPGGHRFGLVTVLHGHGTTVAAVCVHMITQPRNRPDVEAAGVRRLRAQLAALRATYPHVVVGGDWNRAFSWRPFLPHMRATRPPRPTHSPGVRIDYIYAETPRTVRRIAVIGHTYSDHNGVREVIAWHG